ncbi:MAG TPA: ankyrin repeat domain-containing protein [Gemmatimonadaceae bacterium]|jgi:hypothetical protein
MSAARDLPARPSLDSLRKQAKKLARDAVPPLSLRDAQLVIAREYGFAGWSDLSAEVQRRLGRTLDWAASQAKAAIHDQDHDRLQALLVEYPALVAWRDGDQTLLDSTTSYAMDCSDPERERLYTRPVAAELLIDAGATVQRDTWMHVIRTGASGMLHLLARKNALPPALTVLAALGDDAAVRAQLEARRGPGVEQEYANEQFDIDRAVLVASRFKHTDVALRLLDHSIALDPDLGRRIDRWQGRAAFVEFLIQHPGALWQQPELTPWQAFVALQLAGARNCNDLAAFNRWLDDEPWVLHPPFMHLQIALMLPACYEKGREAFIVALLGRGPALLHAESPPPSSLVQQALSYGNAHLVPILARVWPLPNDLPHAAGMGDAAAVASWFDETGNPRLGSLAHHYPHCDPKFPRADLHWGPPTVQQVLDIALAWAVLNHHFEIAAFLLERGADIDTDWATHEPASILHEAAIQGNEPAVRFLIDNGADLTKKDYRYQSNAEGWVRYASHDERMADLLASAAARIKSPVSIRSSPDR